MPSPIGHALGGALLGGVFAGGRAFRSSDARAWPSWQRDVVMFAAVALLPDLDFLLGIHSRHTHSLGAVLAAGTVAWLLGGRRPRWALAVAAAYASHLLLDWLGTDTTPPIGIMALWPLSEAFVQSDLHLFMATSRRYWLDDFWSHNLTAVLREIAILGPPTLAWWWWRSRRRTSSRPGS